MIFLKITSKAVESATLINVLTYGRKSPRRGPILHGTNGAVVGSLLAQGWVLLKDHSVGPWGDFSGRFHLKYSFTHIRNLSYKFEHKNT